MEGAYQEKALYTGSVLTGFYSSSFFLQEVTSFTWFCNIIFSWYSTISKKLILDFLNLDSRSEARDGYKRNAHKKTSKPMSILMKKFN